MNWDALNSGLLINVLIQQNRATNQAAAIAAEDRHHRDLQYWKSVAKSRYDVTDPIEVEEHALDLMAFDQTETTAQERRDMGHHLPWRPSVLSRLPWTIAVLVLTFIAGFVVWAANVDTVEWRAEDVCDERIEARYGENWEETYNTDDTWEISRENDDCVREVEPTLVSSPWGEAWDNSQPLGWLVIIGGLLMAAWVISPAYIDQRPNYHPQDDSIICAMAYPGRKFRTRSGQSFVVSSTELPEYEPRRLRFRVPSVHGTWYSSDDILWDDTPSNLIDRGTDR